MAYPNDSNTVLLLHMDGADEHTTFTDTSVGGGGHTVTAQGNAQGDTAQKKFGTASALFDGAGDFLEVTDHADFTFGTNDFCISMWIRFNEIVSGEGAILFWIGQNLPAVPWFYFYFDSYNNNTGRFTASIYDGTNPEVSVVGDSQTWNLDQWYFLAFFRKSNDFAMSIDGIIVGTDTGKTCDMPAIGKNPMIGGEDDYGYRYHNGWIDEVRVLNGYCPYTGNHLVPIRPYPDAEQWSGTVNSVDNPTKINGVATTDLSEVSGVGTMD